MVFHGTFVFSFETFLQLQVGSKPGTHYIKEKEHPRNVQMELPYPHTLQCKFWLTFRVIQLDLTNTTNHAVSKSQMTTAIQGCSVRVGANYCPLTDL